MGCKLDHAIIHQINNGTIHADRDDHMWTHLQRNFNHSSDSMHTANIAFYIGSPFNATRS
jgi:hypothetical protein